MRPLTGKQSKLSEQRVLDAIATVAARRADGKAPLPAVALELGLNWEDDKARSEVNVVVYGLRNADRIEVDEPGTFVIMPR